MHTIEHKKEVRYLGVQLDYLLRLTTHINTQLYKAKKYLEVTLTSFTINLYPTKANLSATCSSSASSSPSQHPFGGTLARPPWKRSGNLSARAYEPPLTFFATRIRNTSLAIKKSTISPISPDLITSSSNALEIIALIYRPLKIPIFTPTAPSIPQRSLPKLPTPTTFSLLRQRRVHPKRRQRPHTTIYHIPRHHSNKKFDYDPDAPPPSPTFKYSITIPGRDFKNFTGGSTTTPNS